METHLERMILMNLLIIATYLSWNHLAYLLLGLIRVIPHPFGKLDRVLINEQWIYSFKDARVENVPIIRSDHGPIVLHLDKRIF